MSFFPTKLVNFYEVYVEQKGHWPFYFISGENLLQCFRSFSIVLAEALSLLHGTVSWLCVSVTRAKRAYVSSSFSCDNSLVPYFSLVMLNANLYIIKRNHILSIKFKFSGPGRHTKYFRVQSWKGASRMGTVRTRGSWWC